MARRTKANTLRASWSKRERDVLYGWGEGVGVKSDGGWLAWTLGEQKGMFHRSLVEELKHRGYDVTTLRFSIMQDPKHPRWAEPAPRKEGGT